MSIGARIKKLRLKNNYTLEELGTLTNLSKQNLHKYERGIITNIPKEKIEILAKFLKCSPTYLIGWDINGFDKDNCSEINNIYNELSPKRQQNVINYAKEQLEKQNILCESAVVYSYVNLYGSISAGTGNYIEDLPVEQIRIEGIAPKHDIALKVNGDSMLPLFENDEIVYINKTQDINNGQIGAFILDGEAYLKKLYKKNGKVRLVSLNKKYSDIEIEEYNDLRIVGRVVL